MPPTIRTGDRRHGPLQENFEFVVPEGYSALVGPNNSCKSALLQQAFRVAVEDDASIGVGAACLILPDRTQLSLSTETGGRALENFNQELVQYIEKANGRTLMVSTHSHLFLNRHEPSRNVRVKRVGPNMSAQSVESHEELYDISFGLLGYSTEDLFFPGNYLLVEGASDQIIVERVIALRGIDHARVKVVASGGIDAVPDTLAALERALLPMVMRDSPYASLLSR